MCVQCVNETETFLEFAPGWCLVRSTVDSSYMDKGDWGILKIDDPDVVWKTTPWPEPVDPTNPDDDNDIDDEFELLFDNWAEDLDKFKSEFILKPLKGYELVLACMEAGYDSKEDYFIWWLFDHMGKWIKNHMPMPPGLQDKKEYVKMNYEKFGYGKLPDGYFGKE